ncbi:DUF4292 domain-containing protein [Flaviaesturariibacter amylovorans]|uniref:DUF4292 domain-containing protein n=1 Tax=Flaviaesturariibacter amylovorans TaxID=1084520 RepID=A0ABP8G861_9BACT
MKQLLSVLVLVVLLSACRSTKKIGAAISKKDTTAQQVVGVPSSPKSDSIAYISRTLSTLRGHQINFTTFTAKVNIDYKDAADKNYNVNATVRMYKDSAIWISANALLGIEALRALITKDSVKILDKLNKVYTARSMEYLQDVTDLPLDLPTMQDLLLGNPIYLDSAVAYGQAPGAVTLVSVGEWFKHLLTLNEKDLTLQHGRIDDLDPTANRTAELDYSDYETKKGFPFATKRRILLSVAKKLDVRLDFRQYDFGGTVSFPFNVPKNYKTN